MIFIIISILQSNEQLDAQSYQLDDNHENEIIAAEKPIRSIYACDKLFEISNDEVDIKLLSNLVEGF